MKIISASILLACCWLMLNGVTVAYVDGEPIDGKDFQNEMELLPDSLDVMEKRQLALDKLIEKELLIQYADEQGIVVSEEEVEAFFIKQFFDHPLFLTEGEFDYAKFYELKETDRVIKILDTMHDDILIEKTRELVNRQSEMSEDQLLEKYIKENVSLDISYAEFDLNDVSVSRQLTADGARQYWKVRRDQFTAEPKFKMGFTIIPYAEFIEKAKVLADTVDDLATPDMLLINYDETDSLLTNDMIIEFEKARKLQQQKKIDEMAKKLAKDKSYDVKATMELKNPILYPKLTTGFLEKDQNSGSIPKEILQTVQLMHPGEISEPYPLEKGWLLYWLVELKKDELINLADVKDKVWDSYVSDQSFHSQEGEFQRYFFDHLDEFKVPAIQVYRVELFQRKYGREWSLGDKRDTILTELQRYLFNLSYMTSVARDNGLLVQRRTIYTKRYHFKDEIDEIIAGLVNDGETYGVIEEEGREFFYVLENYIPSYIPDFEDLNIADYYGVEVEHGIEEDTFKEYYNNHKQDFQTADSLAVAGVHCWINPDSVIVDSAEISEYYDENYNRFYHDDAVNCRFILIADWDRAKLAHNYLNRGYDWEQVAWAFADNNYKIKDGLVEYKKLPERIANILKGNRDNSYLYPLETDNGWLIVNKIEDFSNGYYPLSTVTPQIKRRIAEYRADSLAYRYIKAVFDSTTYFSDCYTYAESKYIFETAIQDIDQPYDEIGDLSDYKTALLRLWRNEKLTRIVETDKGYAVLFVRRKVYAKDQTFEEALPEIKELFAANKQLDLAKDFVQHIVNDIKNGNNPDSILFFHNGYKRISNLNLDSIIPGIKNSSILIDDMLKHEAGYYSPILKIDSDKLMFYHINHVTKVTRSDFRKVKDDFYSKVKKDNYTQWLMNYRKQKEINIQL